MKVAELKQIAESFGVEIGSAKGKNANISAIEADGVTLDMYNTIALAEKGDPADSGVFPKEEKKEPSADAVLIRMERSNGIFETYGLQFTREHPYALAEPDIAQLIFDTHEGFRPATPKELQEFYS
jgi:hypothetical protein